MKKDTKENLIQDDGIAPAALQDFFDATKDLEKIYSEKRAPHIHGLFKDIEITRKEFILLTLVLGSLGCIIGLLFDLTIFRLDSTLLADELDHNVGFMYGLVAGIIFAGYKIDVISKRLKLIQYSFVMITINLVLQINFLGIIGGFFVFITFLIDGFFISVIFLTLVTLFLEYSSILERGRVLAFLIIETIIFVLIFSIFSQIGIYFFPPLLYISLIFNVLTIYYIYREKNLEKPPLRQYTWEEKHINKTVIIYCLFIFFFSFTVGIASPVYEVDAIMSTTAQTHVATPEFIYILILLIIFITLTAIIVGFIFDNYGRMVTISSIIFIVAMASFFTLIDLPILYINEVIIVSSYIAVIMTVILLVGDITKRKNYGKVLTVAFTVCMFGLFMGLIIKGYMPYWVNDQNEGNLVILGIQYLSTVMSLIFLVNSKETLPHKEKEWYESLFHLYIVHKSGMLLYDYEFIKEEDKIESDLVSGGIIGLTTLLSEIVKGKEKLRTIDHGEKKLMFKYSPKKDVIFVLVIAEDLLVIRDKMDKFILEFIEKYEKKLVKMDGVIVSDWVGVSELIDKYFQRKYFELFMELINKKAK